MKPILLRERQKRVIIQTNKMTSTSITQGRKETTLDGSQGKLLGKEIFDLRPNEKRNIPGERT